MTYFKSVSVWQQTSAPGKAALLCGVSLIAWGIVTGLPRAANAQTISGPQSSTVDNTTNTDLTIAPGAVLTGQPGVLIYQPGSATISNAGAIAPAGFSDAIQLNYGISVDLLINTSTGSIAGKTGIYILSPITTLTNIGTMSAITDGVNSNYRGAITQLINTGTISGGANGLYVYDQITTITNGGLLQGTNVAGIQVNGTSSSNPGFVGVLTNSGMISSTTKYGIDNLGGIDTIATIINVGGGTISGGSAGIYSAGSIGALTNGGLVSGMGGPGVDNLGYIATITNLTISTISASFGAGVDNSETIGALTNDGVITSASYVGFGNEGNGSIGAIVNTGLISGPVDGLYNYNQAGTITNSGTISGSSIGAGILNQTSFNGAPSTIAEIDNQDGGTVSGVAGGIQNFTNNNNTAIIGVLTNAGLISASTGTAIASDGTIGALTNSGTGVISGRRTGIGSSGFIGTLTNDGMISATNESGISNSGTIGTLTNNGVISSANKNGILNSASTGAITSYGTIGALTNSGTGVISGADTGIINSQNIGTLTNGGLISGTGTIGVFNFGSISAVSNLANGTISGGLTGIVNLGEIDTLTNAGIISGATLQGLVNIGTLGVLTNQGTIAGSTTGLYNQGTLGTLTNSGVISSAASNAAGNDGTLGTLTNTGMIAGARTGIYNGVNNPDATLDMLFNNGGVISGQTYGVENNAIIGTLINSGLISSATDAAIGNYGGTISVLTNTAAGTISSATSGVYSSGSIGTLTNQGLISVGGNGIYNQGGTIGVLTNTQFATISSGSTGVQLDTNAFIGTLTNAGVIIGASDAGVDNDGSTITVLTNLAGATIAGNGTGAVASNAPGSGIINGGLISALTNGGIISSLHDAGIYNKASGSIATFLNQTGGIISGGQYGIANAGGVIDTMTNQAGATIAGNGTMPISNVTAGNGSGIYNSGTITALTNGGMITSLHDAGVYNGTLSNIDALDNQAGGTISGQSYGIANNGGTIATLTNNGFINAAFGIGNGGTIGTLVNTGTVTAIETGLASFGIEDYVENDGLIAGDLGMYSYDFAGTIVNNGTIAGVGIGIADGGTLISLVNNGDISGTIGVFFLDGTSTIGAVTNGGSISGVSTGFSNTSSVGSLSNSGAITGGRYGFDNGQFMASPVGSITALTNSGNIAGGSTGIYNGGTIGTISNSGTISGGLTGIYSGTVTSAGTPAVVSPAVISQITNTGTIYGATGIYLTGGGTNIFNGGTIASTDGGNAVFFGGADSLTLTTGSVIIGTIAGSGAAGQIVLEGDGSLDNVISNFGAGSALAVTPGADWTGTGNWTIAQVRNDGVFQAGRLGTPLNVTGDYLQNADGTLRVLVTTTENTELNITGTATLAGTVSYVLAPGHYVPHVYPYITATTVVGGFTTVNYGDIPTGLASTQYLGDPTVDLVITGSFFIPNVAPEDDTIFSAQTQALAQTADADTASLLGKAVTGGAAASPACAAEAPLAPGNTAASAVSQSGRLASTLASAFCGAGGWVEATGSLDEADSSGGAASYNANTAGFLAGVDKIINAIGTRLGFAVGYDQTYLSDKSGGGGSMGTTRVALYGSQPLGAFTLAGVFAYGNANNSTSRNSGIGDLSENNSESIWSGGFQVSTDLSMHGLELMPAAGIRVASVGGGAHFAESATGIASAYAVSGKTSQYNSVQPYVLVNAAKNFVLASGITVRPNMTAGYEYEAGTHGVATTLTSADGTVFFTPHTDLDPSDVLLSGGISAGKGNWSLFATYTARLASNWNTQTAEAGLRILF